MQPQPVQQVSTLRHDPPNLSVLLSPEAAALPPLPGTPTVSDILHRNQYAETQKRQQRRVVESHCQKYQYQQLCPHGAEAETIESLTPRLAAAQESQEKERANSTLARQGWPLHCRHDAIYDTKTCTMHRGSLYVFLSRSKGVIDPMVSIIHGKDSFPGRTTALRVDTLPPHTVVTETHWSGPQAQSIIKQLLKGNTARTRFIEWPYGNAIDDQITLDGFAHGLAQLQHAVRQPWVVLYK
jgi:hypothetical protein